MNAVTTKPQTKTSRTKPAARASAVYVPSTETDLRAKLDTLQAALTQAKEHIESAFDAADDGSSAELLLDHLAHALLADAMRPMMDDKPTRADAKQTYGDLFLVMAALNGAMAMAAGTSIHPVLQEAFELLDWSQNECDSQALIDLLPQADVADNVVRATNVPIKDEFDPELVVNEAVAFNNLAGWIIGARDVLEAVKLSAQTNPTLAEQLRRSDVRYNGPEWFGQGADDGMAYLLMHQRSLIEALGRGAA